jgi:hypothetical protein
MRVSFKLRAALRFCVFASFSFATFSSLVAQDDLFGEEEVVVEEDPFGAGPQPQPQPKPPAPKPEEPALDATRPVVPPPSGYEVELLDGTLLRGELDLAEIAVATNYGELKVPLAELESIAPGLNTRASQKTHIANLIERLGADAYADRQQAQAELVAMGPQVSEIVRAATTSDNAERAARAKAVLEQFVVLEQTWGPSGAAPLAELDEVSTRDFAASGQVQLKAFTITGLFGSVEVELQHVKRLRRASAVRASEVYTSTKVAAEHMLTKHTSPIVVRRGDLVSIRASGIIKRDGSSTMFKPEGNSNYGYFNEQQRIMMGALLVQIGEGGEVKLAGTKISFVADADGPLTFSIAAHPQYARTNLDGNYDVQVRVSSAK